MSSGILFGLATGLVVIGVHKFLSIPFQLLFSYGFLLCGFEFPCGVGEVGWCAYIGKVCSLYWTVWFPCMQGW